ncbi:MAG: hypothetical protein WC712_15410 [Candidatus Brocadiia bacterium]
MSDEYIPIGPKPFTNADAWRALHPKAKAKLKEMRQQGYGPLSAFGGTPGRAPYWMSQEAGNPAAAIEAQHYLQSSILEFRSEIRRVVRAYLER